MKTVIFDIDGVLADFEGQLVYALYEKFGEASRCDRTIFSLEKRYSGEILEYAQSLTNDPNFYYGLPADEGLEFANLVGVGNSHVSFVSSRPWSAESFTRRWLDGKIYADFSVYCGITDKVAFCLPNKDFIEYIVEDNPFQIEKLKNAGFKVFCFDQVWNQGIFPRVYQNLDGEIMLWERPDEISVPFFSED